MPMPESDDVALLVVPQGRHLGPELRHRVLQLTGDVAAPVQVVPLPAIPRSADGAVDRGKVIDFMRRPGTVLRYEPPGNDTERALVDLVLTLLPDARVSITDTLGALGGDSVVTVELAALVSERFGVEIEAHALFTAGSLHELASLIDTADGMSRGGER
jgi:acyl carrier protein